MAAFDSTSNFNATFTNSYATVSLDAVSTAAQLAAGFVRTSGQKYFEFVVDQAGNKPEKLWLGVYWGGGGALGWAIGGNSETGTIISSGIDTVRNPVPGLSLASGDVISFAIDFDGGESPDGSSVTAGAPGVGQVAVAKNGVWTSAKLIFPNAGPFVSGMRPMVIREKGGGMSIAAVTLRVDSLSFSYLPAGWTEWGQSGGVTYPAATTLTWGWSGTEHNANYSITAGVYPNEKLYAAQTLSGSSLYTCWAKSEPLPTACLPGFSRMQFEYHFSNSASANVFMTYRLLQNEGIATLTNANATTSLTYTQGIVVGQSGFTTWYDDVTGLLGKVGQLTPQAGFNYPIGSTKTQGLIYDPTMGILGQYGPGAVSSNFIWNPDDATAPRLLTVTSSSTVRFIHQMRGFADWPPSSITAGLQLNAGQYRFIWPLFPGTHSVDRTRGCVTTSYVWKMYGTTISATQTINLTTIYMTSSGTSRWRYGQIKLGHSSGKKMFELVSPGGLALGNSYRVGLNRGTLSWSQTTLETANFLGFVYTNGSIYNRIKYGSQSATSSVFNFNATENVRWNFCVDFENGKIWVGTPGAKRNSVTWHAGGNPAAGTIPFMTFTASTTLYITVGMNNSTGGALAGMWAYAGQDDAFRYDAPTGFEPWDSASMTGVTTTATVTPSVTITPSSSGTTGGGSLAGKAWPFGVRP